MLKLCSNCNGIQGPSFIHGFRHFLLYSTSTLTEGNPSFVNYLVECLRFSKKQALSTSTKLAHRRQSRGTKKVSDFNFIENADSVVAYLNQIGLELSHIQNIIVSAPHILLCNVDKTLKPKADIFLKLGISESNLAEVIKVNSSIFFVGAQTTIVPAVQLLRETLGSDYHVISILKKSRDLRLKSISKTLVPNVAFLQNYGIPLDSIRKQILKNIFSFLWKTEVFQDAVIRVEQELGIPRDARPFLFWTGVNILLSHRKKTIESKKQIFKSFGWTESDIVALVRLHPSHLGLSEAKIKDKLGFLMRELGYKPSQLTTRSALLSCSLEKRIVPRHEALQILKEKGLIKMNHSLYTAICLNESEFLKKFVLPFKEVHGVYAKHAGISLRKLTLESKLNSNVA